MTSCSCFGRVRLQKYWGSISCRHTRAWGRTWLKGGFVGSAVAGAAAGSSSSWGSAWWRLESWQLWHHFEKPPWWLEHCEKLAKTWISVYRDKLCEATRQGPLVGVLLILIPNHSGSNQDERKYQIVKIPFFWQSQQNKRCERSFMRKWWIGKSSFPLFDCGLMTRISET